MSFRCTTRRQPSNADEAYRMFCDPGLGDVMATVELLGKAVEVMP